MAATGKADKVDAVIEALSGLGQSAGEIAFTAANNKAKLATLAGKPIDEHSDEVLKYTANRGSKQAKADAQAELDRRAKEGVDPAIANAPESPSEAASRIIQTGREKSAEKTGKPKDALNVLNIPDENTPTASPQPLGEAQAGDNAQVVLPDNTTLPARWDVVDADSVKATMKEGVNQPRDRSRAASDIQVQGIANNPDFRRLSDSPVMDVGAPTLSNDGAIVGGNGRFEGISRAYDQNSAGNYLEQMKAFAAAKGIDPATIDGMKKPVLVRRVTQPFDTRKLAIASNAGSGLQYSGLELAKIDGGRMKGLEHLEVTDSGDIALTGDNMKNVRHSLGDYKAEELGALVDKNGSLSSEGVRRIRNALLFKAYGGGATLERLVESADNDQRNITGALVKAAGAVAKAKENIPAELDISGNLVNAVEEFSKLRGEGKNVEQHLAQTAMFEGGLNADEKEILRVLESNIRSQKKLSEFIKSYYEAVSNIDTTSGDMFGNAVPTKPELLKNAKENIAKQPDENTDAKPDSEPAPASQEKPSNNAGAKDSGGKDRSTLDLKKQSEEELKAEAAKQQAEKKKADAEKKTAEEDEKKKREEKEIAERAKTSAENFKLGGEAIDELAGQNGLFSKATFSSDPSKRQKAVKETIAGIVKGWKNAPEIIVVKDMSDPLVPADIQKENERQLSQGATGGQPGAFIYNGTVYIISSEMRNP
jgi:hypothetical protein